PSPFTHFFLQRYDAPRHLHSFPTRRSSDLHLGVEVQTSAMVTGMQPAAVLMGKTRLPAAVVLWAAGVAASPLGKKLGTPIDRAGDRKSTRLNSSHVSISYAVFCLKKKNKVE